MALPIWLFGLPNSGKSTLAAALSRLLAGRGVEHELIDGDQVRAFFGNDLGYSPDDRRRNIRRIIFAACLLTKHRVPVIVANILPFEDMRAELRAKLPEARQIWIRASLDACRARDKTKNALAGSGHVFGSDLHFEEPQRPDFIIDTEREGVDQSLARLCDYVGVRP
jgi:adenylylsulfate kinase-like enzyme